MLVKENSTVFLIFIIIFVIILLLVIWLEDKSKKDIIDIPKKIKENKEKCIRYIKNLFNDKDRLATLINKIILISLSIFLFIVGGKEIKGLIFVIVIILLLVVWAEKEVKKDRIDTTKKINDLEYLTDAEKNKFINEMEKSKNIDFYNLKRDAEKMNVVKKILKLEYLDDFSKKMIIEEIEYEKSILDILFWISHAEKENIKAKIEELDNLSRNKKELFYFKINLIDRNKIKKIMKESGIMGERAGLDCLAESNPEDYKKNKEKFEKMINDEINSVLMEFEKEND